MFEVPNVLKPYIIAFCDNGIVIFSAVPEPYRADAEELQKKWAEACQQIKTYYFPMPKLTEELKDKLIHQPAGQIVDYDNPLSTCEATTCDMNAAGPHYKTDEPFGSALTRK